MKPTIQITINGIPITIFTHHITYIEHTTKGAKLHINSGGKDVAFATGLSWKELLSMLLGTT